jgi:hypothetical protein
MTSKQVWDIATFREFANHRECYVIVCLAAREVNPFREWSSIPPGSDTKNVYAHKTDIGLFI